VSPSKYTHFQIIYDIDKIDTKHLNTRCL